MYSVETITGVDEFNALRRDWNGLLNEHSRYRPYLEHEWFELWLNYFMDGNRLRILVVKEEDQIKAIAPLVEKITKFKGIPIKKIDLIGNIASPARRFLLAEPEEEKKILHAIFGSLRGCRDWSLLELHSLPMEDVNLGVLREVVRENNLAFDEFFCFGNWYLHEINYSGDEYLKGRTSNIAKNIKRYRRKLQELGELRFELVKNESDEKIDRYMDQFYQVFKGSWKDWEVHPSFHRSLAKISRTKGWLRLGFLLLGEIPIATQLWLVCNRTAYIVRLAYDEAYRKMIPGVILTAEMIKYAIDIDKVTEVDSLIGDEEYKKDWTPERRERRGLLIFNDDLKGRFLSLLVKSAIPFAERHESIKKMKARISRLLSIS